MVAGSRVPRCHECGWQLIAGAQSACTSCGAEPRRGPTHERARLDPAALLAVHEEDYPALRDAFGAFRAKEWTRFIGASLLALGVDRAYTAQHNTQNVWVFRRGSAVVIVAFDRADLSVSLDAPIVDIRPETEAPLLRAALSAGARLGSTRPARRGDRLVLTMTHKISAVPPPRFIYAVDELARAADTLDNVFAAEFGVRLLGPQMRKGHVFDLDVAGVPRKLNTITAADRPVRLQPQSAQTSRHAAPPPASKGVEAPSVSAADVARFLEVVRELQQIAVSFSFSPIDDDLEGLFHVAGAHRAAYAASLDLDGARLLMRNALAIRGGQAPSASARGIYVRLLQERGHTAPEQRLQLPRIVGPRIKTVLHASVGAAGRATTAAMRRTFLLGALAELVLVGDLPVVTLERLRQMYDDHQASDTRTVDALYAALQEMSK